MKPSPRSHRTASIKRSRRRDDSTFRPPSFVVGVEGPSGAEKDALIDALTERFLRARSQSRIAILAAAPPHGAAVGTISGERTGTICARATRVFYRVLPVRGSRTGLPAAVRGAIDELRRGRKFDLIFVTAIRFGRSANSIGAPRGIAKWVDAVFDVRGRSAREADLIFCELMQRAGWETPGGEPPCHLIHHPDFF